MFGRILLRNWAAANGHGGSPSRLGRRVVALVVGGLPSRFHRSDVSQWGFYVYLVKILLDLILALIAMNELLREDPIFQERVT